MGIESKTSLTTPTPIMQLEVTVGDYEEISGISDNADLTCCYQISSNRAILFWGDFNGYDEWYIKAMSYGPFNGGDIPDFGTMNTIVTSDTSATVDRNMIGETLDYQDYLLGAFTGGPCSDDGKGSYSTLSANEDTGVISGGNACVEGSGSDYIDPLIDHETKYDEHTPNGFDWIDSSYNNFTGILASLSVDPNDYNAWNISLCRKLGDSWELRKYITGTGNRNIHKLVFRGDYLIVVGPHNGFQSIKITNKE